MPSPPSPHPTPLVLAELAQGSAPADPALLEHLATCDRCLAIHAEFARAQRVHADPAAHTSVPPAWIDRGLAIRERTRHVSGAPGMPPRARRLQLLVGLAAAATLVLAVWSWPRIATPPRATMNQEALARPLRIDSYGGLLYREDLLPNPTGLRGPAVDPESDAALAELVRQSAVGARSADEAFWLVASFLGRNDLDNADAHLREAMRRFPEESSLHTLAAILAYKRNDLPLAARHLDTALDRDRSPANLYNRARVARALGDTTTAMVLTRELRERHPGSAIARSIAE